MLSPSEAYIFERADAAEMGHSASAYLNAWIYPNIVSNTVLLPALVLTFLLSKTAKRHPTLINVCVTWILSGIFSLLLFYAGKDKGPEPAKPLCIAQSSLLYGITPMWSVSIFMLLYHVNLSCSNGGGGAGPNVGRFKMILMLTAPYIAETVFAVAALIVSVLNPQYVTRANRYLYCSLKTHDMNGITIAVSTFTAIVCVAIIAVKIQLIFKLCRILRGRRKAGLGSIVEPQLFIRVLVFGMYVFAGMIMYVVYVFDESTVVPDIYVATVGTVVLLIFGSQPEVFRTWVAWGSYLWSFIHKPKQVIDVPREPSWRIDQFSRANTIVKASTSAMDRDFVEVPIDGDDAKDIEKGIEPRVPEPVWKR